MNNLTIRKFALGALIVAASLPLAGCPTGGSFFGGGSIVPGPTMSPGWVMPGRPTLIVPLTNVSSPPYPGQVGNGLSLPDAYHQALRYLLSQGEAPGLVSAEAVEVQPDGLSGASGWTFVFALTDQPRPQETDLATGAGISPMPPAYSPAPVPAYSPVPEPSDSPQPLPSYSPVPDPIYSPYPEPSYSPMPWPGPSSAPVPTAGEEISLQVEGDGDVMAPQILSQTGDPTIRFGRVESVPAILATVTEVGGQPGPYGDSVKLLTDGTRGPVFEVDPSVDSQTWATPGPVLPTSYAQIPVDGPVYSSAKGVSFARASTGYASSAGFTSTSAVMLPDSGSVAAWRGTYELDAYSGDILTLPTPIE